LPAALGKVRQLLDVKSLKSSAATWWQVESSMTEDLQNLSFVRVNPLKTLSRLFENK
jgi:hypothetical protein